MFLEISLNKKNIEILYLLSRLKEPVHINYKKACCYEARMHVNNDIFVKNIFNPFHDIDVFL